MNKYWNIFQILQGIAFTRVKTHEERWNWSTNYSLEAIPPQVWKQSVGAFHWLHYFNQYYQGLSIWRENTCSVYRRNHKDSDFIRGLAPASVERQYQQLCKEQNMECVGIYFWVAFNIMHFVHISISWILSLPVHTCNMSSHDLSCFNCDATADNYILITG